MDTRVLMVGWILLAFKIHECSSDGVLKVVNLVYRHGDRSPIAVHDRDPNGKGVWPDGMGWLTKIGKEQSYELGQWLRTRYDAFLNSSYVHTEIRATSSDEDRCLMTAECTLAGLYPPSGDQVWNKNFSWQPIPVQTRPGYEDNRLHMGEKCPEYTRLIDEDMKSPRIVAIDKDNQDLYDFLYKDAPEWGHQNVTTIWKMNDLFICETAHGFPLVSWANDMWKNENITVFEKLLQLDNIGIRLLFSGSKNRLKGGPLLKEFIENMRRRMRGETKPKMYMHTGHDTTIAALLSALGLFEHGKSPPYTAMVIVELREKVTVSPRLYYVNIWYKNETDTAYQLTLPGCDIDCPYDQFISLTKHVVPTDWEKECGLKVSPEKADKKILTASAIASIVLAGILVITLFALVITCMKLKNTDKRHDDTTRMIST